MMTTEEAAQRLGVKPATIYAYVSRGLLTSERNADGKGSLFAESEIEAFATARRRRSPAAGESPLIRTGLTLIKAGHLYFRGHDAAILARSTSFESVATLLWTGELPPATLGAAVAMNVGGATNAGDVMNAGEAVAPGVFAVPESPAWPVPAEGLSAPGSPGESAARGGPPGLAATGRSDAASAASSALPAGAADGSRLAGPSALPAGAADGSRLTAASALPAGVADGSRLAASSALPAGAGGGVGFAGPSSSPVGGDGGAAGMRFWPSPELLALAEAVTAPLPAAARLTDRLRVIVAAAAAADPFRFDTAPTAVLATGRTMIGTMVAALPLCRPTDGPQSDRSPLASVLWPRLTAKAPTPAGIATLNAALVLLADHDMAASTLAARVAASTRAHPYAVVGAGLAALDGPLHGAASGLAYALLADAVRTGDPVGAISDRQRAGESVAGFGHRLYPEGDPRAITLLALLEETSAGDAETREIIGAVAAAVTRRSGSAPNIDFAIAAFALLNNMDANAGEAIFAIARTAGWIAHALEEYADRPSRFRPSGLYAGRTPAP
jgi:citrate synthase